MTRTYRIERWITVILLLIFVIPFVAEAENFYAALAHKSGDVAAPSETTPSNSTLPEETLDNAIDLDPKEEHLGDDECC